MISTKYEVLVRTLDSLCKEAPLDRKSYHPDLGDIDKKNLARSKAYLHLFLKVRFGLLTFSEREKFVTEGSQDGGIDAYYIDVDGRMIYFIQSKFRVSEKNFEEKSIEVEELLRMDIDRILDGENEDLNGVEYNSKIKALVREVRGIDNISRYNYQVIVLANVKNVARNKITTLTGGFNAQVFDYSRCYKELLFPLVSANYYTFDDLKIALNLSNKNAGSKISYSVVTEIARVEITVVFIPTIEIAKAMDKYRNAILKYNPRSYLEHEGQSVNGEIRRSIEKRHTNEFALFNNGITILSDGTFLNERIGQKERAQLSMINPQIINGGQTAYTLSQIFREHSESEALRLFGDKEVLVKIITFDSESGLDAGDKLDLIEEISRATNSQTVVSKADRRCNESELIELQQKCFEVGGIWLERKRGEFMDGVREGYIDEISVTDRNLFFRGVAVVEGKLKMAANKKIFLNSSFKTISEMSDEKIRLYCMASLVLRKIAEGSRGGKSRYKFAVVSRAYVVVFLVRQCGGDVDACVRYVLSEWDAFISYISSKYVAAKYWRIGGNQTRKFDQVLYFDQSHVAEDVIEFYTQDGVLIKVRDEGV